MEKSQTKVCVTGGSGYIGSCLVKKLLEKGYTVHATLRNLDDKAKVGLLSSLPNAQTNLVLFKADIYNPDQFQAAIDGCLFVFHVAYPLQHHSHSSTYKDRIEAMAEGSKRIAESCIKSGTVKRLIYTASVMAASPFFRDGNCYGYGPTVDESRWTPLDVPFQYSDPFTLVGNLFGYNHGLMYMQELLGSVPLVHVEDVCEALIFCMEIKETLKGRFICAAGSMSVREIATYIRDHYPELHVDATMMGEAGKGIKVDNSKIKKMGFNYKYDTKEIIGDSVECAKRLGALPDV
ncbi:Dihydroflavonol 4-reductase [Linum perenne]